MFEFMLGFVHHPTGYFNLILSSYHFINNNLNSDLGADR